MKTNTSINILTMGNLLMSGAYLRGNPSIKAAFVYRQDARCWQVLEGNPDELTGFVAGEFPTKRQASEYCASINERIANARQFS
jgi:hypothetical protein